MNHSKKLLLLLLLSAINSSFPYGPTKLRRDGLPSGGTHYPALAAVVVNTSGPVLEMGCGDFSTPFLHSLCAPTKRLLVSTDVDKLWISLFLDLECNWHKFIHVNAYATNDHRNNWLHCIDSDAWNVIGLETHWSVVFIDHTPGSRRPVDVARLRKNTDIFVVHDTEDPRYGWEPLLSSFKYKYVYDRYSVTTTIVSDTIDVTQFFN